MTIPDKIRQLIARRLGVGPSEVFVRKHADVISATVSIGEKSAHEDVTQKQLVTLGADEAIADLVDRLAVQLGVLPNHGPAIQPLCSAPDRVIAQVLRDIMSELDVPSTKARKVERLHEPSVYWDMIRAAAALVANGALWRREYIGAGSPEAEVPR